MFSQGMFSIGGIASGLDTAEIISQLMRLERQPVVRMEQRQAQLRKVDEAWGQISTRLTSLRSALDDLQRPEQITGRATVTSSNESAVGVAITGTPQPGSLSFRVTELAASHQVASDTYASPDALVGAGTLTLTAADGTPHTIDTDGSTTLADVRNAVNDLDAGVSAQVLKVADGQHRLVLTSAKTGESNQFTLDGLAGTEVVREGRDATLDVGGVTVKRASNTITDLVDGVTLTLRAPTTDEVTIRTAHDVDGMAATVKKAVDALSSTLKALQDHMSYNAEAKTGGVLQGDPAARRLAQSLRDAATALVDGPDGTIHPSSVGINLDRNGQVTLDEAKLKAALAEDPDAVARVLSRVGSTDSPDGAFVRASSTTASGTYAVVIDQAADVARVTGASYTPPTGDPTMFTVKTGGKTVTVTLPADTSLTGAIDAINQALSDAGVDTITASEDGDAIRLEESRYGSQRSFTVAEVDGDGVETGGDAFGLAGTHAGVNVAGTINGEAATGSGKELTSTAGAASGLVVRADAMGSFDVTYSRGVAGNLNAAVGRAVGSTGAIGRARASITSQINVVQQRIDAFEVRLGAREVTLRRQFVGLEVALGQLNSQGAWLSQQLAGLNGLRPPNA